MLSSKNISNQFVIRKKLLLCKKGLLAEIGNIDILFIAETSVNISINQKYQECIVYSIFLILATIFPVRAYV